MIVQPVNESGGSLRIVDRMAKTWQAKTWQAKTASENTVGDKFGSVGNKLDSEGDNFDWVVESAGLNSENGKEGNSCITKPCFFF